MGIFLIVYMSAHVLRTVQNLYALLLILQADKEICGVGVHYPGAHGDLDGTQQ